MSSFNKLSIQGIRCFGPEDKDRKVIKFIHPLTLILGDNGCGKTTIIESLKYATTGELPPNMNNNAGFVHDPNLTANSEVRGQINLNFKDIKGDTMCIQKIVQSTQKIKKLEFKTLDQVISRFVNGTWSSISLRCADTDSEMCYAMGVTKAVLSNVLLCHQDDSNWPLEEDSKVKVRFDAIFGAVKYNKCLDHIKKTRKQYQDEVKVLNADLRHLTQYKNEAGQKRARQTETEIRMFECESRIETFLEKLKPIEEQLKELASKEDEIGQMHTDLETRKTKLESIRSLIRDYKKSIQFEFKGSLSELEDAIENFQIELKNKQKELEIVEKQGEDITIELKRNNNLISEDQLKVGQLTRDAEKNKERIETRNTAILSLSQDFNISTSVSQLNQLDEIQKVLSLLEDTIVTKEAELVSFKEHQRIETVKLQQEIDKAREDKVKVEQDVQNKKTQIQNNKRELEKVKNDIREADESSELLGSLQSKFDRVKRDLEDLKRNNNMEELENELKNAEQERENYEDKLVVLEREIQNLQLLSSVNAELEIQRDTKGSKDAEIKKLKKRHEASLKHLLKDVPEQGIKFQLEACMDKIADEIKVKAEEIKQKENEISTLEAGKKHVTEKLKNAKQCLEADEFAIKQACTGKDYESYVEELGSRVQELQDQKGTLSSSEYMFRRYVQKLQQQEPCCPLCHRGFQEEDEITKLISELTLKVREVPSKLRVNKEQLDTSQEKYKTLLQLKPRYEKLAILKSTEIPNLEDELGKIEKKLVMSKTVLNDLKTSLEGPESDEAIAKSMHSDIVLLEQYFAESRRLAREIQRLEAKLPSGNRRSLEEALDEQKELRASLQSSKRLYDSLLSKRNNILTKKHGLQEQKNSLQEQQLKISGNAQMRAQLAERRDELENVDTMLQMEVENAVETLCVHTRQLDQSLRQMKTLVTANTEALDLKTSQFRKFQNRLEELKKLNTTVLEYEASGGARKLESAQNSLMVLQRNSDTLQQKKESIFDKRDHLKNYISSQKVRERELDDNMKLREKLQEEKELLNSVEKLQIRIGNLDYSSLHDLKRKLKKEEEKLYYEKGQAEGSKRELEQTLASIQAELNMNHYKNADKNYRDKMIELEVTQHTIEDLNQYWLALDWAMMNYHKKRMEQINTIIKDLWRKVYSGNDIDTIEIKTEQESTASADKRRAYKYRVVQVKTGTELDMRGRCSAGQKVLASLIIRIALAETFSSHCGVLALDEPTTNLDHKNIVNLSNALEEICRIQSAKENFLLIVITHDQEFLDILTQASSLDTYYKITRNQELVTHIYLYLH